MDELVAMRSSDEEEKEAEEYEPSSGEEHGTKRRRVHEQQGPPLGSEPLSDKDAFAVPRASAEELPSTEGGGHGTAVTDDAPGHHTVEPAEEEQEERETEDAARALPRRRPPAAMKRPANRKPRPNELHGTTAADDAPGHHTVEPAEEEQEERETEDADRALPCRRPAAAMKRPAARKPRPNERCANSACRFCPTSPGTAAAVQRSRGETRCLFCDADHLRAASKAKPNNRITKQ